MFSLKNSSGRHRVGFTLLEMLIVLAILAILTPIIYSFAGRLTARQQLEEGSQNLAQALSDARSAARKSSRDSFVRVDFNTGKSVYRVRICQSVPTIPASGPSPAVPGILSAADCDSKSAWKDTDLPNSIQVFQLTPSAVNVATGAVDLTYSAPYSRTNLGDLRFQVRSKNYPDLVSNVNVLGVTGKVIKLDRL